MQQLRSRQTEKKLPISSKPFIMHTVEQYHNGESNAGPSHLLNIIKMKRDNTHIDTLGKFCLATDKDLAKDLRKSLSTTKRFLRLLERQGHIFRDTKVKRLNGKYTASRRIYFPEAHNKIDLTSGFDRGSKLAHLNTKKSNISLSIHNVSRKGYGETNPEKISHENNKLTQEKPKQKVEPLPKKEIVRTKSVPPLRKEKIDVKKQETKVEEMRKPKVPKILLDKETLTFTGVTKEDESTWAKIRKDWKEQQRKAACWLVNPEKEAKRPKAIKSGGSLRTFLNNWMAREPFPERKEEREVDKNAKARNSTIENRNKMLLESEDEEKRYKQLIMNQLEDDILSNRPAVEITKERNLKTLNHNYIFRIRSGREKRGLNAN